MKDALKSIGADLANELIANFQTKEFQDLLSATKDSADEESGTFEVVITTENIDRYQEVIKLDAWETERYLANPVVLWGHDHNRLIGMATSLEVRDGKMVAKGKFAPTEEGQDKRRLYDLGFLRATSVGFIEKEREGNLITKAELLEFSFVSVPANPYALSLAVQKELNINELVTKGIMFVEKESDDAVEDTEDVEGQEADDTDPAEGGETPVEQLVEGVERNFSTKQLTPVLDSLKGVILALEALGSNVEEPEGEEVPSEEADAEEQRNFLEFRENRKLLQDVDTMLGEVLAEARKAREVR